MRFLRALPLLLTASCSFDAAVPDGATIRCDQGGVCPTGLECQARTGLCVRQDRQDRTPPRLSAPSLTPTLARQGERVRASFTVDEPLSQPPRVVLAQTGRTTPFTAVAAPTSSAGGRYEYELTVDAEAAEGLARVTADLTDQSGNDAVAEAIGDLTLDFTPPSVQQVDFVSPRPGDGGFLELRPTEPLSLRVTLSEAVRPGPTLTVTGGCDGGPTFTTATNTAGLLDFRAAPPLGATGCEYGLSLAGLVDLAGNAHAPVSLPARFALDGEAPRLAALELLGEVDGGLGPVSTFSRAPGHAQLTLRFETDESAATLAVRFDEEAFTACELSACAPSSGGARRCSCTRALGAADAEGRHSVSVTVADLAGNARSASAPLTLDLTPPHVVTSTVQLLLTTPTGCARDAIGALGATATGRLLFAVDEPASVALSASPQPLAFTLEQSSATSFSYAVRASPDAGAGGAQVVTATLTDAVGNSGAAALPVDVVVDAQPPGAPDTLSDGGVLYTRQPWGTADAGPRFWVTGQPGAAEPGTTIQVVDDRGFALGRGDADDAGAFLIDLTLSDRPAVALRAVDSACNASAAAPVRNVRWIASLAGKVPGSLVENPHVAELQPSFVGGLTQSAAVELGPPTLQALRGGGSEWLGGEPRWRHLQQLVFDTKRQVLVTFGGNSGVGPIDDLWEWNGGQWRARRPAAVSGAWPAARQEHSMAYDEARGRTIVFGGYSGTGMLAELWEWDGEAWLERKPAPGAAWPSARADAAMAYDPVRRNTVLYGGTAGGLDLDDLWEWDGERWRSRTPTPRPSAWPSARNAAGFVYDSARAVFVLVCGYVPYGDATRELWEWNGTTWTHRTPASPPAGTWPTKRLWLSATYDSRRHVTVMFGGATTSWSGIDELWEWDGATFVNRTPSPRPAVWPEGRFAMGSTYDPVRGLSVFATGEGGPTEHPMMGWDGTSWVSLQLNENPYGVPPRSAAGLTYDTARDRLLLFGGHSNTEALNDLWDWDGQVWRNRTPTPLPTAWPPRLEAASFVFDASRGKAVLFGGALSSGAASAALWEWDGSVWVNRTPTTLPSSWPAARKGHAAVYDSQRHKVVVFGGELGNGTLLAQLWEWDGSVWTNRTPTTLPANWPVPRREFQLAYDSARDRVVLSGGTTGTAWGVPDVWEWNGTSWSDRTPSPLPAGWPTAQHGGGMAYDAARGVSVGFAGFLETGSSSDAVWEWTGTQWRDPRPAARPGNWPEVRYLVTLAYDPTRQRVHSFGGLSQTFGAVTEHWSWGPLPGRRPAVVVRFGLAYASVEPGAVLRRAEARFVSGGRGADAMGASVAGVELHRYQAGEYFARATTLSAPPDQPAATSLVVTDPTELSALFRGARRDAAFALTPVGVDTTTVPATVVVSDAVMIVDYRRP